MIKLKTNLNNFINVMKVVENLVLETDITFDVEGIYIRAIHPSKHCFITFNIKKTFFEEYNIQKSITYTLDMGLLNKILKKVGKKEIFIKNNEDTLMFSGSGSDFKLNYFVGVKDEKLRPDIATTSKWKFKTSDFFTNIEEMIDFSDVCQIGGNPLSFHTKSNMVDGLIDIPCELIESDGCWCWYDASYLYLIRNIKDVFKEIRIGFSNEQPIIIKGVEDNIDFEFMLACRVLEDEG